MSAQPPLHERTGGLRQRPSPAIGASRMARQYLADKGRGLLIAAVGGVFLALAGAFQTGEVGLGVRLAYWLTTMVGGGVVGGAINDIFRAQGWLEEHPLRRGAVLTLVVSVPLCLLVWPLTSLAFHLGVHLSRLIAFYPIVLLVSAVMVAINMAASHRPLVTHAGAPGDDPVRFLERLPPRLRGAELWAVEAEDHYLRLHTSKGQDLILMRLGDAVAELEGLEGAQTHRSWWVARSAVTGARRGDGRATLTLKDGAQAPVSRAYSKALREAGWY